MKITSEDLAKLLGIKIGDKIKYTNGEVADVIKDYILDFHPWRIGLHIIIDEEFEILPQKKKVGENICRKTVCKCCPLRGIKCFVGTADSSLYETLNDWYERFPDKELYDILKAKLDKEEE